MSEEDDSEKEFEPTQHKLDEARKRGDLVKSTEISVAAAYAGVLVSALGLGTASFRAFGERAMVLIDQAESLSHLILADGSGATGAMIGGFVLAIAPWFVLPMILVMVSLLAQRALVFAPEKLMPKLSRIDPISNAGQKFGRSGLFEFAKSTVKLVIIGIILGKFLLDRMDTILLSQRLSAPIATVTLLEMLKDFLILLILIAVVIGGVDYLWQRAEFQRRNRMTRKELMDEMKQSEGDPHMKAQRRQRGIAIAMNQMISDVKKADVVVVNPTHYAVALQWERKSGRAPTCLAKGVDEIAARIREVAMENGVPIHSDPPTARAMYATVEVGQEIRPEHYKPVAAAIRFAEKMRRRAKERGAR